MKQNKFTVLAAVWVLAASVASAQFNGLPGAPGDDPPVTVNGGWMGFTWTGGPNVFNIEGPFTYSSAVLTRLTVTDGGVDGDRFTIFDNGVSIGNTSVPTNDGYVGGFDYDVNLVDPRFSHGTFDLAPGAHSITIEAIQIATGYPDGLAGLRVDVVVPEPGTLGLMSLGALAFMTARRRR